MANTDKNIVITPNVGSASDPTIVFSGANSTLGAQNITLSVTPVSNGTITFSGSAGQLFSVTNSLTGSIFSVNDVSGIPSIEVFSNGQVNLAQFNGNVYIGGQLTSANLADSAGYKGIPQVSKSSQYTLALTDIGEHIDITTGGIIIPANSSVAFPIGSVVVIFNDSASTQTISITTDTLRQAGTTNTGTRTLAAYGVATLMKVAATVWVVTGNVS